MRVGGVLIVLAVAVVVVVVVGRPGRVQVRRGRTFFFFWKVFYIPFICLFFAV